MKTMVTPPEYPDLKIKKIVTDEGDALDDFIYNPCAMPIPGFVPIKQSTESNSTLYLNADKILAFVITDEEQQHMRTDLIKPKEYKERG